MAGMGLLAVVERINAIAPADTKLKMSVGYQPSLMAYYL
ncbi:hypothetical protein yrohd0001_10250 [Yersinia rohdei ATCC 43380]|nr:hypothetical protein yrohd0001_10250 [Yersinia rohdei ATCC 43380]